MRAFHAAALLLPTLFLLACDGDDGVSLKTDEPVFDPGVFRENIETTLQQIGVDDIGYAIVVNHLGRIADSAQTGHARMPQDGDVAHSISREMNIASVTKWLTAVGAIRFLSVEGISLDQQLLGWLPRSWEKGPGVETLTFRDLLTHRTGLTTDSIRYGTGYNSLKAAIETGVVNPAKSYNYSNINFALYRILFAHLDDLFGTRSREDQHLDVEQDTAAFSRYLANEYVRLMQEFVFDPANVGGARMRPNRAAGDPTLMYSRINTGDNGTPPGDWTLIGGGGGYYLSPKEVASVLAHVFHSEEILASEEVTEMENDLLGFDSSPATERGPAYQKNGALFVDVNGSQSVNAGDHGLETLAMKLPGDVEVVLFVNSLGTAFNNYVPLVVNAYENAWVDP